MVKISHPVGLNGTDLAGACPAPFLDPTKFTSEGRKLSLKPPSMRMLTVADTTGRLCAEIDVLPGSPTCCLPCPATDWLYPQRFVTWSSIAEIIATIGLVLCAFLMVSWVVLPPSQTRRHYLSICLTVGISMMLISFVIPLGSQPAQCYDEITPNDMYTDLSCAFSGAFVIAGGLVVTVWTFIRALSMHLQICWDIVPGKWFFYAAQALGWGIAAVLFTVTITLTGVSYRFGEICHVNPTNSMADFWGPLLGIAVSAALVQFLTFFYCLKVYLKNLFSDERTETNGSSGLPSYHSSSVRTASARAVYQRVKKVLWLQWRSITIVLFILIDVIFFAIVWVQMDNALQTAKEGNLEHFLPFLKCLFINGADGRDMCFEDGQRAVTNESIALGILMLLALTGIQCSLMLFRVTIFTGWWQFFKAKLGGNREFVSLDARAEQKERPQFELVKVGSPLPGDDLDTNDGSSIYDRKTQSPVPAYTSPTNPERPYRKNTHSFSYPRSPVLKIQSNGTWRAEETFAPSGIESPSRTRSPNYDGRQHYFDTKHG